MWLVKKLVQPEGEVRESQCDSDTGSDVDPVGAGSPDLDSTEEPMPPEDVLRLLQDGNDRFVRNASLAVRRNDVVRRQADVLQQPPHAAIVGCSDCQCALETIFDSLPGDIFAFKNVGNTCIHANGSMAVSLEFCTHWGCRFILVLGHWPCVAIEDATRDFFEEMPSAGDRALKSLMSDLRGAVAQAVEEVDSADVEEVARAAVKVNCFHTVERLLKMSPCIRENVGNERLQIHAAVYDATTRKVEFFGPSPRQKEVLKQELEEPESWEWSPSGGASPVRNPRSATVTPATALAQLREGNERFRGGAIWNKANQRCYLPHSAVLACGDIPAPADAIFDTTPGEIFVMRNAGNTCTHSCGSIMSSFEFCVKKFNVPLIMILGHTPCACMSHAVKAHLAEPEEPGLLESLEAAAAQAEQELGPGASIRRLADRAVKLSVFHTLEMVLAQSQLIQELVRQGRLDVQGAIYHKDSGAVEFVGRLPHQDQILLGD